MPAKLLPACVGAVALEHVAQDEHAAAVEQARAENASSERDVKSELKVQVFFVDAVTLAVTDMHRSVAFYADVGFLAMDLDYENRPDSCGPAPAVGENSRVNV